MAKPIRGWRRTARALQRCALVRSGRFRRNREARTSRGTPRGDMRDEVCRAQGAELYALSSKVVDLGDRKPPCACALPGGGCACTCTRGIAPALTRVTRECAAACAGARACTGVRQGACLDECAPGSVQARSRACTCSPRPVQARRRTPTSARREREIACALTHPHLRTGAHPGG